MTCARFSNSKGATSLQLKFLSIEHKWGYPNTIVLLPPVFKKRPIARIELLVKLCLKNSESGGKLGGTGSAVYSQHGRRSVS